jgi:hypothetical protein
MEAFDIAAEGRQLLDLILLPSERLTDKKPRLMWTETAAARSLVALGCRQSCHVPACSRWRVYAEHMLDNSSPLTARILCTLLCSALLSEEGLELQAEEEE